MMQPREGIPECHAQGLMEGCLSKVVPRQLGGFTPMAKQTPPFVTAGE
jgi:hypothetical protein